MLHYQSDTWRREALWETKNTKEFYAQISTNIFIKYNDGKIV
jgi:hypothetical protein